MKLAGVVWVMDGTQFDSSSVAPHAFIAALKAAGTRGVLPEDVIAAYGLGPPSVLLTPFLGRSATSDEIDGYHRELERAARTVAVYPGIQETLRSLQPRVRLALFTGASVRAAKILLRATGLFAYFDAVVGGDEIAHPKPAPDGLLEACVRVGVPAARAACVGDAPVDLEAARRAGAIAIAAGWGHMYEPANPDADIVAMSPLQLPGLVTTGAD